MGILADLFVATSEEAKQYNDSILKFDRDKHLKRFAPVEMRNLTSLEFGALWALIQNQKWDYDKHDLEQISLYDDGHSWLYKFPTDYIDQLAHLNEAKIAHHAKNWANTEELTNWKISDTANTIFELTRLSKQTLSMHRNLYLWGSV